MLASNYEYEQEITEIDGSGMYSVPTFAENIMTYLQIRALSVTIVTLSSLIYWYK
jgi:hypothetical protein